MSHADLLSDLNEPQRQAVTHREGPMLILAGAGSGKTRTITYRIAHLIQQDPALAGRILAVTFTNKAAEEMKGRVISLLPPLQASPLVCTFHSFAVRVLRRYAQRVGYRADFTICDTDDQKRVYRTIYREMGLKDKELPARMVRSVISRAKNQGWGPREFLKNARSMDDEDIARVFDHYQRYMQASNAVDFDDLILLTVKLLRQHEDVRFRYSDWFRFLLIDEYQDTNKPQYDLIRNLTELHSNVCAVGDEDQSIYGFRGADINNILRFEKDYPGTRLIKLEQNYRSTQVILDAAGAVVANNLSRKGKTLWTESKGGRKIELFVAPSAKNEAGWVCDKIEECLGWGEEHLAVLYRTNFMSREFEEALRQRRIPYRLVGGVSFYSRKEVKDALAYLRLAINRSDNVSFLRIVNEPARGIGRTTLERLQKIASRRDLNLGEALSLALREHLLPGRAHKALQRFSELMDECESHLDLAFHLCLDKILESSGYRTALREEGTEEADNRLLNLDELINVAREASQRGATMQSFLDEAALRADTDEYDAKAAVTLMTLHNAKGLEFSTIFLVGCEEGLFPHQRAIQENDVEEERRLCYVGLTRAQRKIHLSYSRMRRFFGRDSHESNQPSRFLNELPTELVEAVHSPSWSPGSDHRRDSSFLPSWNEPPVVQRRPQPKAFAGITRNSKKSVQQFLDNLPRTSKPGAQPGQIVKGGTVEHPKYGRGRVLHVQDMGKDSKVTVQFPGLGIKKLIQSYARLRPV